MSVFYVLKIDYADGTQVNRHCRRRGVGINRLGRATRNTGVKLARLFKHNDTDTGFIQQVAPPPRRWSILTSPKGKALFKVQPGTITFATVDNYTGPAWVRP